MAVYPSSPREPAKVKAVSSCSKVPRQAIKINLYFRGIWFGQMKGVIEAEFQGTLGTLLP